MSLLPSDPDIPQDGDPRVVGLDSEAADDLMDALSSTKARRLLLELQRDPAPPGELADRIDASLQNTQYHLEKLEDAGAIEVVGTAYSEKGREMDVYGPADDPLVIFVGEQERSSGLRAALSRLFAGWLSLGLGALAVQELFGRSVLRLTEDSAAPPEGTPTPTPAPESTATPTATSDATSTATPESTPTATTKPTPTETPESTPTATPEPTASPEPTSTPTPQPDAPPPAESTATPEQTPTPTPDPTPTPEPSPTPTPEATPTPTPEATPTPTPTPDPTLTPTPEPVTPTIGDGLGVAEALDGLFAAGMPPGVAFFLGGSVVLTALVAMTYVQQ